MLENIHIFCILIGMNELTEDFNAKISVIAREQIFYNSGIRLSESDLTIVKVGSLFQFIVWGNFLFALPARVLEDYNQDEFDTELEKVVSASDVNDQLIKFRKDSLEEFLESQKEMLTEELEEQGLPDEFIGGLMFEIIESETYVDDASIEAETTGFPPLTLHISDYNMLDINIQINVEADDEPWEMYDLVDAITEQHDQ